MGISNTVRINGELVRGERLNILGLALAIRSFRLSTEHARVRNAVAIAATLACAAQIPASAGLYSPQNLIAFVMPGSDLPPLAYKKLDERNRRIPESILAKKDPAQARRAIASYKVSMIDYANTHMAYADLCYGGRYRIDVKAVKDLPDFLTEEDRMDLAKRIEGTRRLPPEKCSEARSKYAMGELVDDINRMWISCKSLSTAIAPKWWEAPNSDVPAPGCPEGDCLTVPVGVREGRYPGLHLVRCG